MIRYRKATFEEIVAAASGDQNKPPGLDTWQMMQAGEVQLYRDAVAGGARAKRFLIQKPDEDPLLWGMREESYQNINVCEIIVDEQSHFAYGEPPEREVRVAMSSPEDERNEILNRHVGKVYEDNCAYTLFRAKLIPASFTDQWAWLKVWWDDDGEIRLSRLPRENVFPIRDPKDPDGTLLGVVEIRKAGREQEFWLHSLNPTVVRLDKAWTPMGSEPNPIAAHGVVPFIPFGDLATDGKHQLRDAAFDQIVLINMRSWELTGWRAQAFSIFVAAGEMINEEAVSSADGQKRTEVGFNRFLQFEKDGKFYAVNPNFPIEQVRNAQSDMLREALERAKVSSTAVDSSGVPEQPHALVMRHLRPLQDRKLNIASFRGSEQAVMKAVSAAIAVTGQLPHNPAMLEYIVRFPDDVLPINETEIRARDAEDVAVALRTREDYVRRWVKAGATDDEIKAYMALLDQQAQVAQQSMLDSMGFGAKSGAASKINELYPDTAVGKAPGDVYADIGTGGGGTAAGSAPLGPSGGGGSSSGGGRRTPTLG